MLPSSIKSEVKIEAASRSLIFGVTFGVQREAERHFGKPFGQILTEIDEMLADDLIWLFWAGLQRHQPDLALEQMEALIDEIGPGRMWEAIRGSITLAYDVGKAAPGDPARPPKARGKAGT